MTLQEYYESKGISLEEGNQKKAPVKKGDVNAEWIKKEKLTVLETKEDKKHGERNKVQVNTRQLQPGINAGEDENAELLGFHSKPSAKPPQRRDEKR